jgi:oligopeptide/dipeptide ABC transporter ATP-binding protein
MNAPLLEARDLVKHFPAGGGLFGPRRVVHALSGVSFSVERGETLAVVGESGCGKTTLAHCLTGLTAPTAGSLRLDGEEVSELLAREPAKFRRGVQIVFQDPYASLNPRRTVARTIGDALRLHDICPRSERRQRSAEVLGRVGLSREHLDRYPHELSGGQRQRVAIARALAVGPQLVICDEPVSALDVSIRAQIVNLLRRLQGALGVAYVFISHDLALVRHISSRVAVMYLGQIVEVGATETVVGQILHPYARALFASTPEIGRAGAPAGARRIKGEVPSPLDPPSGCRFRTRCPFAAPRCEQEEPALRAVAGRDVRCHFAEDIAAGSLVASR